MEESCHDLIEATISEFLWKDRIKPARKDNLWADISTIDLLDM
jgi:hypothetical protein